MRGAFAVDEPSGKRWDLALELLATGEAFVSIGHLLLWRDVHGPTADGRLHVEIGASAEPKSLSAPSAQADINRGLDQLGVLLTDPVLAQLAAKHGVIREYVSDYETGWIALAAVSADGSVTWEQQFRPRP